MNLFYRGAVVVVARGSILIHTIPLGSFLQESVVSEVNQLGEVKTAVPMLFVIGPSRYLGQLLPSNITIGMPAGRWSTLVGSLMLMPGGRWPSASKKEVVIGVSLSNEHSLKVDSKIRINNHELRVVGILNAPLGVWLDRTIILSLETAQEVYDYKMLISMLVVEPQEGVTERELAERLEEKIRGITAITADERDEIVQPIFNGVEVWNLGIRSVIFFMSMMLVMLVAVINVSERRMELATLNAMGAPKTFILRLVVVETGMIGFLGGVLGILLGTVAALLIMNFYTGIPVSQFLTDLFQIVPPAMMIEILASTVTLSCIAGTIPTILSARRSVTELLRAEY